MRVRRIHSKSGWRVIGGKRKYYRSKMEANYARYLEWLRLNGKIVSWRHEPETYYFPGIKRGTVSYLPDFRIVNNDGSVHYVETKGYMDAKSKTKIKRMAKYFPDVTLIVVDNQFYGEIIRKVSRLIPDWEA